MTARDETILDAHTPDCAPLADGSRGHFCAQCSEAVQEYVNWPCPNLAKDLEKARAEAWDSGYEQHRAESAWQGPVRPNPYRKEAE